MLMVTVLISMMEVEWKWNGNFKQMETRLIDELDNLINSLINQDEKYHEVFNSVMLDLTQHLSRLQSDSLSATSVLEILLYYRGTLQGEHNRNKKDD